MGDFFFLKSYSCFQSVINFTRYSSEIRTMEESKITKYLVNLQVHNQRIQKRKKNYFTPLHKGAIYQFPHRWIYYWHSSKSTGKETGKTHLCVHCAVMNDVFFKALTGIDVPKLNMIPIIRYI